MASISTPSSTLVISDKLSKLAERLSGLSAAEDVFGLAVTFNEIASIEACASTGLVAGKLLTLGHMLDGHALTVTEWDCIQALAERFAQIIVQELPPEEVIRAWESFVQAAPLR